MAYESTTIDLIKSVRERSNTEHSNFVTDPEIVTLLNRAHTELWDFLVQTWEDYVVLPFDINLTSEEDYDLPPYFYKCLGVDMWLDSQRKVTLQKFNFSDRNRYQTSTWLPVLSANPLRYRIVGNHLRLIPKPTAGTKLTLWYAPMAPELVMSNPDPLLNQTDRLTSILPMFNDYITLDAAMNVLAKEESDTSALMKQKQETIERIRMAMANRDTANDTVTDVYSQNSTIFPFWPR